MAFDLKTNMTVGTLEDVPSDLRTLYTEREDGTFGVGESHQGVAAFIGSLQGSLARSRNFERDKKTELERLKAFQTIAEDPDSLRAHLDELNQKIEGASGKKEDLERFKEEYQAKHKGLLDAKEQALLAKDTSLAKMRSSLESHLIDAEAVKEIAKAKGSTKLLARVIRDSTRVVENENGKYEVQVLGEDGSPRYGATGLPVTIAELVAELKSDAEYACAFASDAPSGSGSKPNGAGPRSLSQDPNGMTSDQKIQMGLDKIKQGRRR